MGLILQKRRQLKAGPVDINTGLTLLKVASWLMVAGKPIDAQTLIPAGAAAF